jgi:hypothetical protein
MPLMEVMEFLVNTYSQVRRDVTLPEKEIA